MEQPRPFYKILVVGKPGSGKTSSLRKLNRETTGFIDTEAKPLPFKDGFTRTVYAEKFQQVLDALVAFSRDPKVSVVVLESLSATLDILYREMSSLYKGFDLWRAYNEQVGVLLDYIKRVRKEVIVIGHYEILNTEGAPERRLKIRGKEWEGMVEKEFTIVLFADILPPTVAGRRGSHVFWLTKPDTSAKCPPGICGEDVLSLPNDINAFLGMLYAFLGLKKATAQAA
jgi:hypothetical protein